VRRAARTLGVVTDASQRFERGCDPEAPPLAQDLAAHLLRSLAGGRPDPEIVDVYPEPFPQRRMSVRAARVERLLGYAPARAEAERALAAVGLAPEATAEGFDVTVPSWRVDLEREADLVEEIGRDLGYDRIPSHVPASAPRGSSRVEAQWDERVRDRFAALGFSEAFNYAMVGPGDDADFVTDGTPPPLALTNPIAEPMGWLRRALAPGLLRAADQNVRRGVSDVRLFEVGSIFLPRRPGELPDEPLRAAFAWCGTARPAHWCEPARAADATDAAGLVEDILALTQGERDIAKRPADLAGLHPGRSTLWTDADGRRVAWCGPVHPELSARLDLSGTVLLGEIDLSHALPRVAVAYRPVPRVPGMTRDLSILLEPGTPAGAVLTALRAVAAPAPVRFQWIDRFEGEPLPSGQAAMTLRVILQPLDRTLTDDEAESFRSRLVTALEEVSGARLRRIDT
jgi:phenylalanyl-tRNA synthetase beta chain